MNEILEKLATSAVVPVVVLDDAKDAVATANALLAGGVDVMEITFRTAAAADSIKAVAESCPRDARWRGYGDYAGAVQKSGGMRREVHCCPRL